MALHEDGGYAGTIGKPLGTFFIPPSYGISFFNKMIDEPLDALNLQAKVPIFEYTEELGDVNLQYSKILHFSVFEGGSGKDVQKPRYVPYIDSLTEFGDKTIIKTKPLVEVINPTFYQLDSSSFALYFFSNFTSAKLPDANTYNDDPKYLRRTVDFSTNRPDLLDGKIPSSLSEPYPNDRNYYIDEPPEDETPRAAFLSTIIRMQYMEVEGKNTVFAVADKPLIVTWIGHRFYLDSHPSLLVNKTQFVEWAEDKEASDDLDEEAVEANPPRQIPYHHVISGIETVMYPSYSGINFYTKPITDVYDVALDHYFRVNGSASKNFDIYAQGRKIKSIGIRQEDLNSIGSSDFSPFERHFSVVEVNMDDFRKFSSSSSSSVSSYSVDIPSGINITGDDKPYFWKYYWDECGSLSSSASGGSILMEFLGNGSWYGEECIDGIKMYAKLEERPYGYYNSERAKFWLTIGPLTITGVELDIVWQGYKVDGVDGDGSYTRYYGLGDETPGSINIS